MIKIEITDPHLLNDEILTKTANYLLSFVKQNSGQIIIPLDVLTPGQSFTFERNADSINTIKEFDESLASYENKPVDHIKDFSPEGMPGTYDTPEGIKKYNNSGIEIDNNGIPWDSRIHAKSKTKNTDGNWKLARGIDISLVDTVVNELLGKIPVVPSPPPLEKSSISPEIPKSMEDNFEQQSFDHFVSKLTQYLREGKTTRREVNQACETVGLENFTELQHVPELIPQVLKKLEEIIGSKE